MNKAKAQNLLDELSKINNKKYSLSDDMETVIIYDPFLKIKLKDRTYGDVSKFIKIEKIKTENAIVDGRYNPLLG